MALHHEASATGLGPLQAFDGGADKLQHGAAAQAGHVVVMGLARGDLEAPARGRGSLACRDAQAREKLEGPKYRGPAKPVPAAPQGFVEGLGRSMGAVCGKPYSVSALAVIEAGNSNIMNETY